MRSWNFSGIPGPLSVTSNVISDSFATYLNYDQPADEIYPELRNGIFPLKLKIEVIAVVKEFDSLMKLVRVWVSIMLSIFC